MALTKIDDRGLKTPIDLLDDEKIRFGTGNDLEIYHVGDANYIKTMNGDINFRYSGQNMIIAKPGGAVELYHNNVKTFNTLADGIHVHGQIQLNDNGKLNIGDSDDLQIYHNGTNNYIMPVNGDVIFDNGSSELARITQGGDIELLDNGEFKCGTSADLRIYHNGSHSYIKEGGTGNLYIDANQFYLRNNDSSNVLLQTTSAGVVQLKHNGTTKFETSANGVNLYGNLVFDNPDTAGRDINWLPQYDFLRFEDNVKAVFGNAGAGAADLEIYHSGTNSVIDNNTGGLYIRNNVAADVGGDIFIQAKSGENSAIFTHDGSVALHYDNAKKFETTSTGVTLRGTEHRFEGTIRPNSATGSDIGTSSDRIRDLYVYNDIDIKDDGKLILGDGDDLQLYHNGTNSYIINDTGETWLRGNDLRLASTAGEWYAQFVQDAAVKLYYDGSNKFETTSDGAEFFGNFDGGDSQQIRLGNSQDLKIYHNGTNSLIENGTGELLLRAKAGENSINCNPDAGVELYYDNTKRFETTDKGVNVLGGGLNVNRDTNLYSGAIYFNGFSDSNHMLWNDSQNNPNSTRTTTDGFDGMKWNTYLGLQIFGKGNEAETIARFMADGACELYYNNSKKFQTENNGIRILGDSQIWFDAWQGRFDRNWDDYPSITITPSTTYGNQGEFRIHGQSGSLGGYGSGADFSIDMRVDGDYESGSDRRRKTNIEDITEALATVKQLTGKKFNIINRQGDLDPIRGTRKQFGLIAQECKDIIPEVVKFHPDADTPNENGWASAYGLSYGNLTPLLINAIKELSAKVEALETEVAALKG